MMVISALYGDSASASLHKKLVRAFWRSVRKTPPVPPQVPFFPKEVTPATTWLSPRELAFPFTAERNLPLGERSLPLGERSLPLGERSLPLGE